MGLKKPNRVVVLDQSLEEWRVLEAEIAAGGITITHATTLPRSRPGRPAEMPPPTNRAQTVLLACSDKSVCRLMNLPLASDEETRRMVALRLETELPYPVADSLWACERLPSGDAAGMSPVLVLATPSKEISEVEQELGFKGRNPWAVQSAVGALAELAPFASSADEPVAICRVGERSSDIAVARDGRLQYARRLFIGSPRIFDPEAVRRLGVELDQCMHHYSLDTGAAEPKRMLVVGEGARIPGLADALAKCMNIIVEVQGMPPGIRIEGQAGSPETIMDKCPACVGALIAMRRMRRGEKSAAPLLRVPRRRAAGPVKWRSAALVLIAVGLLAFLVATSFGFRNAQIKKAEKVAKESHAFISDMETLQDQVAILEYENGRRRPMLDVMMALSEAMPKTIKITNLNVSQAGKVTIAGLAPSAEEASDKAVAALEASKMFKNPKFLGTRKQDQQYKFSLTCELKNAGERGPANAD